MIDYNLSDSTLERGKRLRALRKMAGLTIMDLAKLCDLGESTIRQWERGRGSGLSVKGAHKVIHHIQAASGIQCEVPWLVQGRGNEPDFSLGQQPRAAEAQALYVEKQIQKEIQFFCEHADKPVFTQVTDNAMQPMYNSCDYVGGNQCFGDEIKKLSQQICIVKLADSRVLVRKLKYSDKTKQFKLYALNPSFEGHSVISNVDLISAALVSRVWRNVSS